MEKNYVVVDLTTGLFYVSAFGGWTVDIKKAYLSKDIKDAERVISQRPKGFYKIETVYTVN